MGWKQRDKINKQSSDSNKYYAEDQSRGMWERMMVQWYFFESSGYCLASQICISSLKFSSEKQKLYNDLSVWHLHSERSGIFVSLPHILIMAE